MNPIGIVLLCAGLAACLSSRAASAQTQAICKQARGKAAPEPPIGLTTAFLFAAIQHVWVI
jgi:hypothetical protein